MSADLVLRNGRFTTLDRSNPTARKARFTDGEREGVHRLFQSSG
jgi:hypothetical protein